MLTLDIPYEPHTGDPMLGLGLHIKCNACEHEDYITIVSEDTQSTSPNSIPNRRNSAVRYSAFRYADLQYKSNTFAGKLSWGYFASKDFVNGTGHISFEMRERKVEKFLGLML